MQPAYDQRQYVEQYYEPEARPLRRRSDAQRDESSGFEEQEAYDPRL